MSTNAAIFQQHARSAGFDLRPEVSMPWLTPVGHLLPLVQAEVPRDVLKALDTVLAALSGDPERLQAKTRGRTAADFVLDPDGFHVEYDEVQHFTTARSKSLAEYPDSSDVVFSPDDYASVVRRWAANGDKAFAHKEAAEFPGRYGRQRQRAYLDAFRDLVSPYFEGGPLLRIAAPDDNHRDAAVRFAALVGQRRAR